MLQCLLNRTAFNAVSRAALIACLAMPAFQAGATDLTEEIVVTAQKREENLNEVPIAVTVLSSEKIDASFSDNIEDLQSLVPSVSFRTGNTTRNSALTVRGIGTISFSIGAEPSVSTVVDGVVLGRSGQAFSELYDLERIEVLRGPQGTLFGKNASAGVLNLVTKKPSDEFEGYVSTDLYDDEYRVKGRFSGPISDNVRASVTAIAAEFDGYIDNVYNNENVNGYDREGLRAMVDFDVSESSSMRFIYEYYNADDDCCADLEARSSGRNPASEAAPGGSGLDLDQRKVDHDFETRTLDSTTGLSLQFDSDLGNDHTVTSITAYRSWDNTEYREGDFTSIGGDSNERLFGVPFQLHDIGPQEWRQFSQELRFTSPSGGALEYQVGAFYWDIESSRNFTREASCQPVMMGRNTFEPAIRNHMSMTLGMTLDSDMAVADQQVADFIAANNITCNADDIVSATAYMDTQFRNFAMFGQSSYKFSDVMEGIFGLRYTRDKVSYNHNRRNNDEYGRRGVGVRPRHEEMGVNDNHEDTDFDGDTDENNLSGKIGLQWQLNDSNLLYYTYSLGYKGPAFNVYYNMDSDDTDPIDAEESVSNEVGWKFASNTFLINLAFYSTDIDNFQANDFDASDGTTITGFTNGGDVETQGVEVDFIWQPTDRLSFSGGLAHSKAETTLGDELPFAPDMKMSLVGDYTIPLAGGAAVKLNAAYTYTDEQLSGNIGQDEDSNPEVLLPDYKIVNASISYVAKDDRFRLSLIGKNLTDESYATTYSGDRFRYQIPRDADRYFGVSFRAQF